MKKVLLIFIIFVCFGCTSKFILVSNNTNDLIKLFEDNKYYISKNMDKYLAYYILNQVSIDNTIKEVNSGLINSYYYNIKESDLSKDILLLVNKYNYLESSYIPNDLDEISNSYNKGANNKLRHEAKEMFEEMCFNAEIDNINLYNISAYRSYKYQEYVYNYLIVHKGFDLTEKVSARAGHSEHQSGLAVDINNISKSFENTKEYNWLINNSYKYGFILRYPKHMEKITGFSFEPWHYRYVGVDVATKIHEENITFDEYYAFYIDNN